MELNQQQQQAINHQTGPLLIVAGPGSGKTRVVTEKIRYLLETGKARPEEILALTFTQKASEEMLNRLGDTMPLGYTEPWISTFHRFADRVLKQDGLEVGLPIDYKILPYPKQYLLIKENLFDFPLKRYRPLGNPAKFIHALLTFFSRLQDETVSPRKFSRWLEKSSLAGEERERYQELSDAYSFYQQLKLEKGLFDFGDLILWAGKLLRQRAVAKKYQRQFKYTLVDEFQDTNYAQFSLVKLLCPQESNPNLTVVGDDDQAIYRFRGASLANIVEFRKTYPQAKTIVLTKNYRSGQSLLDKAYQLIQNNNPYRLEQTEKIDKRLVSQIAEEAKVTLTKFASEQEETQAICRTILDMVSRGDCSFQQFAILARANSQLTPFVHTLRQLGIPYQLIGNRGLFDREEVGFLLAMIDWLANSQDTLALYQILLNQEADLARGESLAPYLEKMRREKISLFEAIQKLAPETLGRRLLALRRDAEKEAPFRLLARVATESGLLKNLLARETIENRLAIKNINLFFGKIRQYEHEAKLPTIYGLADWLAILREAGDNPAQAEIEDVDTVRLLTIHSAKGLEFDYVFIPSLVAGRFPSRRQKDVIPLPDDLPISCPPQKDTHIQEERRLLFVGITRARKQLWLSYAEDYGGVRKRKPSGFLQEITSEAVVAPHLASPPKAVERGKALAVARLAERRTITHISYSQIDAFRICPRRYRYQYLDLLPAPVTHQLSFGLAMHRALREFHRQPEERQTERSLLDVYRVFFRENSDGYEDEAHKRERYLAGEKALKRYYREHRQKTGKPIFLEKKFNLRIGKELVFSGVIDRLDRLPDGGYEIIDYKTGEARRAEKIDKDLQLTLYGLASKRALGIEPRSLALYFLDSGLKATTTRTDAQYQQAEEEVKKVVAEINRSDFPPKRGKLCQYCPFRQVCSQEKDF